MDNDNTIEERWKVIDGYDGIYFISDHGRVYNNRYKRYIGGYIQPIGYAVVNLSKGGKTDRHYIHRLVGKAFVDNPRGLDVINHKDENKSNNHYSNLEWCTLTENLRYGTRVKRIKQHPIFDKFSKERSVSVIGTPIGEGPPILLKSMTEGNEYGFCKSQISACCRGKYKTHKGHTWERV